ncbi:hypothetical protein OE749_14080 [Aestuariibacter sp. AA17]|uniref:Translation initiation factor beta propellor-like domain-containing protein n=1 Tax=Fluctibacter corallii TaxID=2984329 RepID=A0ABT3AAW9_9ALTE|nr:hypothetical protein [Aestuariibacter sp. AA17]MCV2885822.1 hypothetical protein [Aestuariibacter sp. AA17]
MTLLLTMLLLHGCTGAITTPEESVILAEDGALAADVSSDNTLALISSVNDGILVWDITSREKKFQWSHQGEGNNLVTNIHIAPDNSHAVTSDREAFAIWSLISGEPIGFWRIDESSIRDVAVSNQGRGILVGRGNGKVMFFEHETGRRIEFLGHQEKINSVALSPNGFYALTGGNDYVAYLWDTRTGQVIHRFPHSSRVTKVALDDQGRYAFTADSKRDAIVWDVQSGEMISNLSFIQRQKIFSTARFSQDGKYLLTGSPTRRVNLWNIGDGSEHTEWKVTPKKGSRPQSAVVYATGFLPNNKLLTISSSGLAEVWSQ